MEYWSPRDAVNRQQLKKLKAFYKGKKHTTTDPNNYLKMLMENPDKTEYRFRFTKKCLFVKVKDEKWYGGETRINMESDLCRYHNFLRCSIKLEYYAIIEKMIEKRKEQKKLN
jgi:hypothetical protein